MVNSTELDGDQALCNGIGVGILDVEDAAQSTTLMPVPFT
jgi:hypothetical protein